MLTMDASSLQFRLAYVAPESRVVGAGDLVDHPKKIARHYLHSRFFWIDLFVVLPLPQILILGVLPKYVQPGSANYAKNMLRAVILLQYVPRMSRFIPLLAGQSPNGFLFETAWANFVINMFIFVLAGHVVGSCWYLFGLQSEAFTNMKDQIQRTLLQQEADLSCLREDLAALTGRMDERLDAADRKMDEKLVEAKGGECSQEHSARGTGVPLLSSRGGGDSATFFFFHRRADAATVVGLPTAEQARAPFPAKGASAAAGLPITLGGPSETRRTSPFPSPAGTGSRNTAIVSATDGCKPEAPPSDQPPSVTLPPAEDSTSRGGRPPPPLTLHHHGWEAVGAPPSTVAAVADVAARRRHHLRRCCLHHHRLFLHCAGDHQEDDEGGKGKGEGERGLASGSSRVELGSGREQQSQVTDLHELHGQEENNGNQHTPDDDKQQGRPRATTTEHKMAGDGREGGVGLHWRWSMSGVSWATMSGCSQKPTTRAAGIGGNNGSSDRTRTASDGKARIDTLVSLLLREARRRRRSTTHERRHKSDAVKGVIPAAAETVVVVSGKAAAAVAAAVAAVAAATAAAGVTVVAVRDIREGYLSPSLPVSSKLLDDFLAKHGSQGCEVPTLISLTAATAAAAATAIVAAAATAADAATVAAAAATVAAAAATVAAAASAAAAATAVAAATTVTVSAAACVTLCDDAPVLSPSQSLLCSHSCVVDCRYWLCLLRRRLASRRSTNLGAKPQP
ncbi:putative cyclic nucleotide-gated ion channel 20 [Nymphaea thermarum]|nr:putative cyclic nucleotide-gated ion channel 20 [Nymphaea thermarum]